MKLQGQQDSQDSADCTVVTELFACFIMGSVFSARRVRPAARKRLEVSPEREFLIEFIGKVLAEAVPGAEKENDLILGHPRSHLG